MLTAYLLLICALITSICLATWRHFYLTNDSVSFLKYFPCEVSCCHVRVFHLNKSLVSVIWQHISSYCLILTTILYLRVVLYNDYNTFFSTHTKTPVTVIRKQITWWFFGFHYFICLPPYSTNHTMFWTIFALENHLTWSWKAFSSAISQPLNSTKDL